MLGVLDSGRGSSMNKNYRSWGKNWGLNMWTSLNIGQESHKGTT